MDFSIKNIDMAMYNGEDAAIRIATCSITYMDTNYATCDATFSAIDVATNWATHAGIEGLTDEL